MARGVRRRRTGAATGLVLACAVAILLAGVPASAQTAPPPPPGGGTAAEGAEVGRLVAQLSTLQSQLDDLAAQAGDRQELANRAVADDTAARGRVEQTRQAAAASRTAADRVDADAEAARTRVDTWVAAQYQQADAASIGAALAGTRGPQDVADRLQLQGLVTAEQSADLQGYENARVEAANSDSRARADAAAAADAAARAATARDAASHELDAARNAVADRQRQIAGVNAQRTAAQARLAQLEASDAALAAQRQRAEAAQAAQQRAQDASDAAARDAARARLARGPAPAVSTPTPSPSPSTSDTTAPSSPSGQSGQDPAQTVIDRALSELGTTYAWGGGDANGPTQGIHDGGVADAFGDYDKTGFDCSGLMVYAFAAAGKSLPHYSGYQEDAGPKLPLDQRKPGDLLFWAEGDDVHHVALYLGDDKMVEAPESGKVVRITPVRFDDEIVPTVTRPLG
ncbi:NlpC/P60 family protein [Actinomycetospora endophytica]|uniref:NlpC/P60 family protein n=1 Tax=Actinomycetospora endophytica TaxID=2291215 RepID=A0ABS8PAJ9_9PSEU|nr:NlpC/P60 family protein [Actinomycetospora endophytica]MCD2195043.1 NlpC/P60 family protein [Actinomycetospora endophytica]